jgi:DNA-directed RNA polymerase specialized sigma54-like protein
MIAQTIIDAIDADGYLRSDVPDLINIEESVAADVH